jgi:hypothetical protein
MRLEAAGVATRRLHLWLRHHDYHHQVELKLKSSHFVTSAVLSTWLFLFRETAIYHAGV